jgi:hypothetical protein
MLLYIVNYYFMINQEEEINTYDYIPYITSEDGKIILPIDFIQIHPFANTESRASKILNSPVSHIRAEIERERKRYDNFCKNLSDKIESEIEEKKDGLLIAFE